MITGLTLTLVSCSKRIAKTKTFERSDQSFDGGQETCDYRQTKSRLFESGSWLRFESLD